MSERLYYIQCISNYAYDYILWWRPAACGYTHNLAEAGLYTAEEAAIHVNCRGEEVAWHKDDVQRFIDHAVSIEKLRSNGIKPFLDRKKQPVRKDKKPPANKCRHCGQFFSIVNDIPDADECERCHG